MQKAMIVTSLVSTDAQASSFLSSNETAGGKVSMPCLSRGKVVRIQDSK
jgi:hypothetical protein